MESPQFRRLQFRLPGEVRFRSPNSILLVEAAEMAEAEGKASGYESMYPQYQLG